MKTEVRKSNKHHLKSVRGIWGIALIAFIGVLFLFHYLFPTQSLWPLAIVGLGIMTMIISHIRKSKLKKLKD